ncbi:MAG: amidohydrolase family protein [Steroidobacteraceae bacterium]|nr:amidohydrolase family protein [Steroidobacteraceae bacterium]
MKDFWLGLGLCAATLPALVFAQAGRAAPPDHYLVIHAGTLLAVPGEAPRREMTIVVKNDRIAAITPGYAAADGIAPAGSAVETIDLSRHFVLPGLMDAHVHLQDEPSIGRRGGPPRNPPAAAEHAVNAIIYARRSLAAGFTTLRDLGADDRSVFAARDAFRDGRIIGPRILAAGSAIAVTAGHGDTLPPDRTGDPQARLEDGTCDGPAECRAVVRFQAKRGADVIKVTATGGFSSNTGLEPQLFPDEIEAIVATAHLNGLKAAAHAYAPLAIRQAVQAGIDSIEHGFLVDDEGLALMKKSGTFLVPTLSASYPPPVFRIPDPASVRLRNEHRAFERAYAAGVKIAFGTDAGTFTHGDNAKEFELMVKFGMPPMAAIRSATVATAELFGISEDAGTLEPGKTADLIALTANPLENISALREIDFVLKSGRIAKRDGRMTEPFSYAPVGPPF